MEFLSTSIGRKIVMAVTGACMVLFTIIHLLGNSSIFVGPSGINSYAEHLHSMPLPIIVAFRAVMLVLFLVVRPNMDFQLNDLRFFYIVLLN